MMEESYGGGSCPWEYDSAYDKNLEREPVKAPSAPVKTPSEYDPDEYTCEPQF